MTACADAIAVCSDEDDNDAIFGGLFETNTNSNEEICKSEPLCYHVQN